jgi:hypothetical protein
MSKHKSENNNFITGPLFIILFLLAFLERTVFDLGPNYELLTTALILSAYYLGGKYSFWLTFLVIALTDRVIGNSRIFLFTWSGFLIPAILLPKLLGNLKPARPAGGLEIRNSGWKVLWLSGTGILSNLFFFIHTNLGVWLLDSWGMYTKDFPGLIRCYVKKPGSQFFGFYSAWRRLD